MWLWLPEQPDFYFKITGCVTLNIFLFLRENILLCKYYFGEGLKRVSIFFFFFFLEPRIQPVEFIC